MIFSAFRKKKRPQQREKSRLFRRRAFQAYAGRLFLATPRCRRLDRLLITDDIWAMLRRRLGQALACHSSRQFLYARRAIAPELL